MASRRPQLSQPNAAVAGLWEAWDDRWCMLPDLAALAELAKFDLNLPRKRPLL
jgi:hypothetical protein